MEGYYHILFDKLSEDQLERKKLGDLVTIVGGGTPSTKCPEYWTKEGGIPWIGIRDLTKSKNKFISGGERDITEEGFQNSSTKLVGENTILFSCVGNTIGIMGVCGRSLCFAQSFFGMPVEVKNIGYIWFLLKNNLQEFNRMSLGTTVPNIYKKDLSEFSFSSPPQNLIEKFNNYCESFFQIQKTNEREIRELLKLQKYFIELTN